LTCDAPLILLDSHDDVARVIASLREANCSALSATPSMWRKLAMHPDFEHLRLEQVTLGGEIVDEAVLAVLARCFPAARITHIYASTEAGVGFAVHDRRAGFPAEYLTASPFGVRMRIGEDQHLWLAPPGADSTWLDSGDIVRVQGERVLFLGRANGSINVGGNKVMPEEVEAVIRELPYITFVEVRGRRSPLLGSLVEAAVQPVSGRNVDREMIAEIIAHCRARLEAFKVPAFVVKLDAVELNASGKLSRHSKGQAS
jgi:acyl-CoA synthetase (AMP-forming)/AMP-acid ligase II